MHGLIDTVQHNCDIVDARHGADYGMCTYLMKMRERYRWEKGLPFDARLPREDVGDWLTEREDHLEALGESDFRDIVVDGEALDPFDAEAVNAAIVDRGLVYSAGLASGGKPQFFVAELEHERRADDGFVLRISGREFARCLNAPPAMTRGSTIFLRRESLRRYLWEKYENWLWNRPQNAMAEAVAGYPFEQSVEFALDQMTEAEMDVVEAHERGEFEVGQALGEAWNEMLLAVSLTPAELMARAVRDHVADCAHTLPMLIEQQREASVHLFFANLGAMRREIFPSLWSAYEAWRDGGSLSGIQRAVDAGRSHWMPLARQLLSLHAQHGPRTAARVVEAVGGAHL